MSLVCLVQHISQLYGQQRVRDSQPPPCHQRTAMRFSHWLQLVELQVVMQPLARHQQPPPRCVLRAQVQHPRQRSPPARAPGHATASAEPCGSLASMQYAMCKHGHVQMRCSCAVVHGLAVLEKQLRKCTCKSCITPHLTKYAAGPPAVQGNDVFATVRVTKHSREPAQDDINENPHAC